ncbi:RNA polymerase sigma factor [Planctomycetota bacterium]
MEKSESKTSLTLMHRLRIAPGEVDAWTEFLGIYGPRIDAWCRRRGLQEADVQDVTQNILIKLAKQFGRFQYDPSRSFRGWLRTVTESAISDFVNSRNTGRDLHDVQEFLLTVEAREDLLLYLSDAFDLEILAEARSRVCQQVESRHWKVFTMTADDQLPAAEVSKTTGDSVANVFKIKSRVQAMIRTEINKLQAETQGACDAPET